MTICRHTKSSQDIETVGLSLGADALSDCANVVTHTQKKCVMVNLIEDRIIVPPQIAID